MSYPRCYIHLWWRFYFKIRVLNKLASSLLSLFKGNTWSTFKRCYILLIFNQSHFLTSISYCKCKFTQPWGQGRDQRTWLRSSSEIFFIESKVWSTTPVLFSATAAMMGAWMPRIGEGRTALATGTAAGLVALLLMMLVLLLLLMLLGKASEVAKALVVVIVHHQQTQSSVWAPKEVAIEDNGCFCPSGSIRRIWLLATGGSSDPLLVTHVTLAFAFAHFPFLHSHQSATTNNYRILYLTTPTLLEYLTNFNIWQTSIFDTLIFDTLLTPGQLYAHFWPIRLFSHFLSIFDPLLISQDAGSHTHLE